MTQFIVESLDMYSTDIDRIAFNKNIRKIFEDKEVKQWQIFEGKIFIECEAANR